ncbi:ATP-binding protein [Occultella gossypii]|uniref:ATP-binding protein n=1 Tax=Occultella gossypii TaxID=2800820 RepID=UPI001CBE3909|nr:LuxR family transcriptional regulator [Occultella gossypii]
MGRRSEREAVEKFLSLALSGHSGSVVVRGEAGIGKTALLEHSRQAALASAFRVESSVGVESETQFAFAGLHQLCAPLMDRTGTLPEPQQAALGVAFGLRDGAAPDRFLVGLAILNLLAEVAEEEPLLCLVDDAQWLDEASAQVLAFVARRVGAERLALMFGVRDSDDADSLAFAGLPELRLERLGESDARALLSTAVHTPMDEGVRERILAEAGGNPLALLELPNNMRLAHLAGGFELPDALSVPHRLEESFRRRSASLPPPTQLLLLVAASEPTGDAALLWRAAAHLELAREVAAPAEAAGLLEIDIRIRFRHPLVRSAVYQAAMPPDRRRAHGALAEATDPLTDPDRRAWHRAQAVLGADEEAAEGLERSADRARARGGVAAAAAFLQRAAELSPEPAARARRALEGAHAKHEAGATESALELLMVAAAGPLDALPSARLQLLRAQIAFHQSRGSQGPQMLLDAAKTLAPLNASLARETYLQALDAAIVTGDPGGGVLKVAEAARAAPAPPMLPQPADLLLDALVTTFTQGYEAGVPELRRALIAFAREEPHPGSVGDSDSHRWLWLASRTAMSIFDDEMAHLLADRHVRLAREAGALATLPAALLVQSVMLVLSGELARASGLADEQASIVASTTTAVPLLHAQLILAAWRGRSHETGEIQATIIRLAASRGDDSEVSLAQYALAVLHNGFGEYPLAQTAATRAFQSDELRHSNLAHSELIESAARASQPERAVEAMEQLCTRARASGTPWALGMAARAQALTSTGSAAEDQYREAIGQLSHSRMGGYLARTHLVYGEWLRREGRRRDARDQLRTAHQLLTDMGAEAFAARAARELRATGEHPRARTAQPTDELTTQELHVARLVATGATSREVGAQLFLSPRTIEAHLRNIFRKLGITSRRELKALQLA